MTFGLAWIFHENGSLNATTIWIVTLVTALFAIFLVRYRARKRSELTYLQNLQQTN